MPALVLQIIGYIQLAIKFAPAAKEIYADGAALINSMFSANLITADQQAALMAWADAHAAAVLAGTPPPEFLVITAAALPVAAVTATPVAVPETAAFYLWPDGTHRSTPPVTV